MTAPDDATLKKFLYPYDLAATVRPLTPGLPHARNAERKDVELGPEHARATVTVTTYGTCAFGCRGTGEHGPGRGVTLSIPCDAAPHCGTCDCGTDHVIWVTNGQAAALLEALR